jgi:hydroxyethylthiazole kinase-like uncharacterized protein yjeF
MLNLTLPQLKARDKFSHKGSYGHALIAAGSYGRMGAAVLSVKAVLHSGAGLVTALIPKCGYEIMQISNPEAMVIISGEGALHQVPDLTAFNTIAVGPGIGTSGSSVYFLKKLLQQYRQPMVLDADALNIVSGNEALLELIPENSVLTPHVGEFKRLVGVWNSDDEKMEKLIALSIKHKLVTVLKGANTTVVSPEGKIYINNTGNPGMAKGGSGDVLTGIITSLVAQGYSSTDAAVLGVYIHGLAGDFAKTDLGVTAMTASDIISYLPKAFKTLE